MNSEYNGARETLLFIVLVCIFVLSIMIVELFPFLLAGGCAFLVYRMASKAMAVASNRPAQQITHNHYYTSNVLNVHVGRAPEFIDAEEPGQYLDAWEVLPHAHQIESR